MSNNGARTWELIRQQAKKLQADTQSLATSYAIERFMARLTKADPTGRISVKGGQSLGILFGNQLRPTKDLDINVDVNGIDDPAGWAYQTVLKACEAEATDGVIIDLDSVRVEYRNHQGDGGLRITIPCSIHTCKTPFMIDVGIGNEVTFEPTKIRVPGILEGHKNAPPDLETYIYPHENTLAEKICAKIEDGIASIRHKDFFDIWMAFEILKRLGDLRLFMAQPSDMTAEEASLTELVKEHLSNGTLLQLPDVEINDDCLERLGLALHKSSAHRGTDLPDDLSEWLQNEFGKDEHHSIQWANWCRNQKSRLLYQPIGTEQGVDRTKSLAILIDHISPYLEEMSSREAQYRTSGPRF